jgi:ketosteroid isomerase-like protein
MANDEAQIRALLNEFTRAIRNKDAAGAIATLAEDVVAFDLAPPLLIDYIETSAAAARALEEARQAVQRQRPAQQSQALAALVVIGAELRIDRRGGPSSEA